jgi:hypothetical protein
MSYTVPDQLDDLTRAARKVRECWAHDSAAGRLADAVCELSDTLDMIDAENPEPEPIQRKYLVRLTLTGDAPPDADALRSILANSTAREALAEATGCEVAAQLIEPDNREELAQACRLALEWVKDNPDDAENSSLIEMRLEAALGDMPADPPAINPTKWPAEKHGDARGPAVLVSVSGGVVEVEHVPPGLHLILKDYDLEGTDNIGLTIEEDAAGRFVQSVWTHEDTRDMREPLDAGPR